MLTLYNTSSLLGNYPALYHQTMRQREDIIEGYRQGAVAGGERKNNLHSDPTAKKAILLLRDWELTKVLECVGQWIDEELPVSEREILISVWRYGKFGWRSVARDLKQEVWLCKLRWIALAEALKEYLNKASVGGANEPTGTAFASGQSVDTPV